MPWIMKQNIIGVLLVAFAAASAFGDETQLPHITVFGTAKTDVVPDQMIWSLKVENKGFELGSVASDHTKMVEAVLGFLKGLKVEEKTIQTSRMEFGENWEFKSSSRVREGYVASTAISFKITDFELYKRLWIGLAKIPSVTVEDVAYDHTKRIEYQNETRRKAILAAKDKAASLAEAVGSEIGEPLLIEEDLSVSEGWQASRANAALNNLRALGGEPSERSDGLAPGTIPITARVKAAFRLIPKQK